MSANARIDIINGHKGGKLLELVNKFCYVFLNQNRGTCKQTRRSYDTTSTMNLNDSRRRRCLFAEEQCRGVDRNIVETTCSATIMSRASKRAVFVFCVWAEIFRKATTYHLPANREIPINSFSLELSTLACKLCFAIVSRGGAKGWLRNFPFRLLHFERHLRRWRRYIFSPLLG